MTRSARPGREPASPLLAGAGLARIDYPAATWPLDGFDGEHDPLLVRVLLLHGGQRIALAVLDQTSLSPWALAGVRERLARVLELDPESIVVSVSHTFSAPHLADPDELPGATAERMRLAVSATLLAVETAARAAARTLRPAATASAIGRCDVQVNRDVETTAGWSLGIDEDGFSDSTMIVTRISDERGAPIAVLTDLAVQSSVMNGSVGADERRRTTGDLAGAAMRQVEERMPGVVALFLIGAAGDQAPSLTAVRSISSADGPDERRDAGDDGFALVELLGERVAQAVLRLTRAAAATEPEVRLLAGSIRADGQQPVAREDFRPTRTHRFRPAAPLDLPYWILVIGELTVIGVQVELSSRTGADIRRASPFALTAVATMCNGGAKYLPEAAAFDRATYEALSSRYAAGAAERFAEAVLHRLELLRTAADDAVG